MTAFNANEKSEKPGENGGCDRDRTCDPLIKSQLLYQLSYAPTSGEPARGI
jgi:hypothetical protein